MIILDFFTQTLLLNDPFLETLSNQTSVVQCAHNEYMRGALKVMPPILLCCSTSEAGVAVMIVEAEPSHHYSPTFCCHVADGSREAV